MHGNLKQVRRCWLYTDMRRGLTHIIQENVLISAAGSVLLTDVGFDEFIERLPLAVKTYANVDDIRRTAPELLRGGASTTASDVYSLGCLALRESTATKRIARTLLTEPGSRAS